MLNMIDLNFHGKRHTKFDLTRIIKAQAQGFDRPVTAYLCGASIKAQTGIGVVFGHNRNDKYGRFGDGHLIRTSDVLKVERANDFENAEETGGFSGCIGFKAKATQDYRR
jgi:hypothetical protein